MLTDSCFSTVNFYVRVITYYFQTVGSWLTDFRLLGWDFYMKNVLVIV